MPIYTYRCDKCGEKYELIEPIDTKPSPPICGRCQQKTRRVIESAPYVKYKGKGFYTTDNSD